MRLTVNPYCRKRFLRAWHEAGIADYWFKYVGLNGAIVGMTTFGESAPAELLFEEFGFTVDNVVAKAKALL
jgi:transketolase